MTARMFLALGLALWLPIVLWTATAGLDRQGVDTRPLSTTGVLE